MTFGRQTIASVAQLLGALSIDAAGVLLYKHIGVDQDDFEFAPQKRMLNYLQVLKAAYNDSVKSLVGEIIREKRAVLEDALTPNVFDGRWREVERWLLHDGWTIENDQLVRLTPEAEEATEVRDRLIEELGSSDLDNDGVIRKCIEDSAKSFMAEPPDYNDSTTKVRIALETITRRAATKVAAAKGIVYPEDKWSKALVCLRTASVLEPNEEEMMAQSIRSLAGAPTCPQGLRTRNGHA